MAGLPEARRDRRAAGRLFLGWAGLYLAGMFGTTENPDAEVEYQTARSLRREGSLAIGDTAAGRAIVERRFDVREGVDGRWYAWFGVGRAVLGVPFLLAGEAGSRVFPGLARALARETRNVAGVEVAGVPDEEPLEHLAFAATGPLASAGCVSLVFLLARALAAPARASLLASMLAGGGTFLLAQSRSSLSDPIGLVFLLLALLAALRATEPSGFARAGLAAALCVSVRPISALYLPPLAIYLFARKPGFRSLLAAALPAAAVGAVLAATNVARFGSPLEFGYGGAIGSGTYFSFPPWLGLLGLLLSPGRGLLFYAPPVLLAPAGFRALVRSGKGGEAVLLAATGACALLPPAFTEGWHGGWCYGPRYALPAAAILCALAAPALEVLALRRAAAGLGLLGFLASVPAFLVPYPVGIARANAEVAARFPSEPENARYLYLLFQPRFAPPIHHLGLLGEAPLRDNSAWARLASVPGYAWVGVVPAALLVAGAAGLLHARRSAASP
ncbi:MAG TPA: hypothetical protein VFI25_04845 [Planctomycetota bacterium]|jgi:hypothetical protein|nr:hypothetical protein [Planctomycetota bacterium]